MSLQSRYDSLLKDMISLLQQALFRFFTEKQVDAGKFKQYFCQFYKGLASLQQNFHQKSTKFTKSMTKLSNLFEKNSTATKFSLQPTPAKIVQPSQAIGKPKTSISQTPLNIIGQQQQQNYEKQRQRRSGTAEGKRRSQNFVIDFSQGKYRPKTGSSRENRRYKNIAGARISQTIDTQIEQNHFKTLNSRQLYENSGQDKRQRKSLYYQLQQQYSQNCMGKNEPISQNMVKIPKKKTLSNHRWSFKINKLF